MSLVVASNATYGTESNSASAESNSVGIESNSVGIESNSVGILWKLILIEYMKFLGGLGWGYKWFEPVLLTLVN